VQRIAVLAGDGQVPREIAQANDIAILAQRADKLNSCLSWFWVKTCSLRMSTHTRPSRKQIRPVAGKSSERAEGRNAARSLIPLGSVNKT
jgi:hypothetical protein